MLSKRRTTSRNSQQILLAALVLAAWCSLSHAEEIPASGLSDERISHAVNRFMQQEKFIAGERVLATSRQGIVTLTGSVDNLLARELAVQLAGGTRGVRSVINQIEVDAPTRDDTALREDLTQAIADDPALERSEISIEIQDGNAQLRGIVASHAERILAARASAGVRGIRKLENKIEVRVPPQRDDGEIVADIRSRVAASAWIDASGVEIEVKEGVVHLSGTMRSFSELMRLRDSAVWVAGVKSVDSSQLEVGAVLSPSGPRRRPLTRVSDVEIQRALELALQSDPRVGAALIDVDVAHREVTLQGVVSNLAAKRAAQEDAWNTFGVKDVNNRLQVKPNDSLEDDTIEQQVKRMLLADPFVTRRDIFPKVRDKHIFLHGKVDSNFEKLRAEEIARRARGALFITNRLEVAKDTRPLGDGQIQEGAEQRIFWSPRFDGAEIKVSVQDAVATLTGSVTSYQQRGWAQDAVLEAGAKRVRNQLRVDE